MTVIKRRPLTKDELKVYFDAIEKYIEKNMEKNMEKIMSENYIMLNGKRVDLTEEQLEKLGLKVEKEDYFKRKLDNQFYFITEKDTVDHVQDLGFYAHNKCYNIANYCLNKEIMEQRALHETLSRLLWRFSMQNDGDKIDWYPQSDHCVDKYRIFYDNKLQQFDIVANDVSKTQGTVYFHTIKIAKRAIEEVILPFMKEHPDFVW